MHLNGWQRIGIVASAAWLIGAFIYEVVAVDAKADNEASLAFRICYDSKAAIRDRESAACESRFGPSYPGPGYWEGSAGKCRLAAMAKLESGGEFWKECTGEYNDARKTWSDSKWSSAALLAFAPIPFAWLLVLGLVRLAKWIRAGF